MTCENSLMLEFLFANVSFFVLQVTDTGLVLLILLEVGIFITLVLRLRP